ncbi:hypothetical protein FJ953_02025 [Mesorhizobium sp. B2-3-6]|nr:hypothetical protein FJ953_02025 [Mesorhizobium sp. B2-3-6]
MSCRTSPPLGGDWQFRRRLSSCHVENWRKPKLRPISPLVGEMSGRTEGGAVERQQLSFWYGQQFDHQTPP